MKRRLVNILLTISLLLSVAMVVLWMRSKWAEDQLFTPGPRGYYCRLISSGQRGGSALVLIAGSGWPDWGHVQFYSAARAWPYLRGEFCYRVSQPSDTTFRCRAILYEQSTGGIYFGPDGTAWSYAWGALGRGPADQRPKDVRVAYTRIEAPHWLLASLFAVAPLIRLAFHFRQTHRQCRRLRSGLCVKCGYDLRASKDRCPECGTSIPAQEAKA